MDNPPALPLWRLWFERFIKLLIIYSIVSFYIEFDFAKTPHSVGFWLWNERAIAVIFTIEYFLRWHWSKHGWRWPFTFYAVIDLAAIIPFYLGFFVEIETLGAIRALRILRMMKFTRYHTALDHVIAAYVRVHNELMVLSGAILVLILFASVAIYHCEHDAQPDKFGSLSDSVWWCFVTITTIGYGDLVPLTWPGRIVAIITALLGMALFGTFVSIIGGSFIVGLKKDECEGKADDDLHGGSASKEP